MSACLNLHHTCPLTLTAVCMGQSAGSTGGTSGLAEEDGHTGCQRALTRGQCSAVQGSAGQHYGVGTSMECICWAIQHRETTIKDAACFVSPMKCPMMFFFSKYAVVVVPCGCRYCTVKEGLWWYVCNFLVVQPLWDVSCAYRLCEEYSGGHLSLVVCGVG